MKQGETKRKAPKDKHTKPSWIKRDKGRKVDQEVYAANLLLLTVIRHDADPRPHTPTIPNTLDSVLNLADILDRKEGDGR